MCVTEIEILTASHLTWRDGQHVELTLHIVFASSLFDWLEDQKTIISKHQAKLFTG